MEETGQIQLGTPLIVVTGAQGFIGSTMVSHLNSMGINSIVGIDNSLIDTNNLQGCKLHGLHPISVNEADILPSGEIEAVFHFGAISNTLEQDTVKMHYYNTLYTQVLNKVCKQRRIPLIFSSTAAIYGNGNGPLNLYAQSKLESEKEISDHAVCLRLFNVYGQRESRKGRMASVAFKWLQELRETGTIRIFKNSNQYMRDFVFVDDVCKTAYTLLSVYKPGVYDLGSGVSRSFEEVADCLIAYHGSGVKTYIPMPEDLKAQYQINTRADMRKLQSIGITPHTTSIEDGIKAYGEMT